MSFTLPLLELPALEVAEAMDGWQFRAVTVNSDGKVAKCTTPGQCAVGLQQDHPHPAARVCRVAVLGVASARTGAPVTPGALVTPDAEGRVVPATPAVVDTSDAGAAADPLSGSHVLGVAITGAAAADLIVSVLLLPMGAVPTTVTA